MKILIYGSTYLTAKVCNVLCEHHELVGHLPSFSPIVAGKMKLPIVTNDVEYDIALSIQYDRKITKLYNCFNLHTGLLPEYGGCDILYHTLKNNAHAQGLTLHKITDKFDFGPIISKISYPVFSSDTIVELYARLALIAPMFTLIGLELLQKIGLDRVSDCESIAPTLYKRGEIDLADNDEYKIIPDILRQYFQ